MAEDKARDRVESGDSGRECNAVIRPQGPAAARMDFFNGLLVSQKCVTILPACVLGACIVLSSFWSSANADKADAAVLIPAWRIGGSAYVSLDDLAEILGGRLHPYPSKRKIGLRKGGDLIVFTPFSSVVTVNDVGYRLPLETRYHDSEALYVPSDAILPLLARTLPGYPRITPVEKPVQAVRASVRETRQPIPRTPVPRAKVDPERWTIDTIIIDPGHGGRDPGALGKRGTREKDIVLMVSIRLKKLLEERLRVKAVLTRSTDTFVALGKRARIAERIGASSLSASTATRAGVAGRAVLRSTFSLKQKLTKPPKWHGGKTPSFAWKNRMNRRPWMKSKVSSSAFFPRSF